MRIAALTLLCLAACGGDPKTSGTPAPAGGAAPMTDEHGAPRPLGTVTLHGTAIEVILLGDMTGGVANLDLTFPAGATRPAVVRGWVGVESAVGSRKAMLHKEGANGMHGHVDVPKTLPAGSQIWIEAEVDGKAAAAAVSF